MGFLAIPRLESRRIEALSRRDSISYYSLCKVLGIDAEDEDLYAIGEMELGAQRPATRGEVGRSEVIRQSHIQSDRNSRLIDYVNNKGINVGDVFANTDEKI